MATRDKRHTGEGRPRWLREQRRRNNMTELLIADTQRLVDEIWVDQFQIMRLLGLRSCVERRGMAADIGRAATWAPAPMPQPRRERHVHIVK
jgi:hypothetical protein